MCSDACVSQHEAQLSASAAQTTMESNSDCFCNGGCDVVDAEVRLRLAESLLRPSVTVIEYDSHDDDNHYAWDAPLLSHRDDDATPFIVDSSQPVIVCPTPVRALDRARRAAMAVHHSTAGDDNLCSGTAKLQSPEPAYIVQPFPARTCGDFYRTARELGVPGAEDHSAAVESQEWHQRWWTLQEEDGHAISGDDLDRDQSDYYIPPHFAYRHELCQYRAEGARNPSPEDEDFASFSSSNEDDVDILYFEERKRGRLEDEEGDDEWQMSPEAKRQQFWRHATVSEPQDERKQQQQLKQLQSSPIPASLPMLVRPQAIRVPKFQEQSSFAETIPEDVSRSSSSNPCGRNLFPPAPSGTKSLPPKREEEDPKDATETLSISCKQKNVVTPSTPHALKDDGVSSLSTVSAKGRVEDTKTSLLTARNGLLKALVCSGGDAGDEKFRSYLKILRRHYEATDCDSRLASDVGASAREGLWLILTRPTLFGCMGENDTGDPMYTLGCMTFDMFTPASLICSLQGTFNSVERVPDGAVPQSLREEVDRSDSILRSYDVVTAFTIEPVVTAYPKLPNKDVFLPIRGIMTTRGYTLPDPETRNRHSLWITGGRIEPNDDPRDQRAWKEHFGKDAPGRHPFGHRAKLLAMQLLLGASISTEMADDGGLDYSFHRPLGGHGRAYLDVLYMDNSLRVVRGHRGTVFVFSRLSENRSRAEL